MLIVTTSFQKQVVVTISIFILQIGNYKKHFSDHKPSRTEKKRTRTKTSGFFNLKR